MACHDNWHKEYDFEIWMQTTFEGELRELEIYFKNIN